MLDNSPPEDILLEVRKFLIEDIEDTAADLFAEIYEEAETNEEQNS